ncbi:recombinase family protein [Bacillus sp. T33-2]|uniref:recombinase family protein n=1 Tax=Bacillus sp. T33-2 TaxID=2054168 RepID=UPI0015E0753E|nr:recombinase family protein [Bacillus sp. T33-2]
MAKYGFDNDPKEKRIIGLIYYLHFDLNFSYQEITRILDKLNIKTRAGKSFQKSRIQFIIDDPEYKNDKFLRQETLERVIELKKVKKDGLNLDNLKEAFSI